MLIILCVWLYYLGGGEGRLLMAPKPHSPSYIFDGCKHSLSEFPSVCALMLSSSIPFLSYSCCCLLVPVPVPRNCSCSCLCPARRCSCCCLTKWSYLPSSCPLHLHSLRPPLDLARGGPSSYLRLLLMYEINDRVLTSFSP